MVVSIIHVTEGDCNLIFKKQVNKLENLSFNAKYPDKLSCFYCGCKFVFHKS